MPSPSPSESPGPPEPRNAAPLSDPFTGDALAGSTAADAPAPEQEPEQESSPVLVILTAMANFVFALQVGPNQDLVRWNQQTAESHGQAMNGGLYLLWPGMLIIWGAAWLGFLITLIRKDFRSALIVFLLTAAVWFLPLAFYLGSLIVGG